MLIGFVDDTIVYPYESQFFQERRIGGGYGDIVGFRDTELYKQDLIGIAKLDSEKRILMFVNGGDHLTITEDTVVNNIIPSLYSKKHG